MTPRALVEAHLPLVRAIAVSVKRGVPFADLDDLQGYGCLGLLAAARSYRPDRGASFATWAFHRVRGAMLDGIRVMAGGRGGINAHMQREEIRTLVAESRGLGRDERKMFGDSFDLMPGPCEPPDEAIDRQREAAEVREAIAALPERERRLVEAVDIREERLDETAAGMGMSKSWASRLRGGALVELRSRLS